MLSVDICGQGNSQFHILNTNTRSASLKHRCVFHIHCCTESATPSSRSVFGLDQFPKAWPLTVALRGNSKQYVLCDRSDISHIKQISRQLVLFSKIYACVDWGRCWYKLDLRLVSPNKSISVKNRPRALLRFLTIIRNCAKNNF